MKRIFLSAVLLSSFCFAQQTDSLDLNKIQKNDSVKISERKVIKTKDIDDVVITGTIKPVSKSKSPVNVEIYSQKFFQKNPTPSVFESIAMVNGVQPQLNCSVCNTGDIHINGLEGPYTMILIDGMPIVSSLSTVYGLSGIPNSIIERIEVVKGPASSLYGSEAMGGVINIITKNAQTAPKLSMNLMTTTWAENNVDFSTKFNLGKNAASLLSLNYFSFNEKIDQNKDNFTDAALQNRISVFNKWNFKRKENRMASFALRYLYEDRFGGEMQWNKSFRGSNEVYGESIYTNRVEAFGMYQLPLKEQIFTQFSYNYHDQNSFYGNTPYQALQKVAFAQTYWDKKLGSHDIILGLTFKKTFYDDNTPGTLGSDEATNQPMKSPIFGAFIQDQWEINEKNTVLLGYRFDYDKIHHSVHSPRFAWKYSPNPYHIFRFNFGTGFRVVNLFTEDHAALTGSREVVIQSNLKPEKSINGNLNYVLKIPMGERLLNVDTSIFYTYFSNKIVGDFDTDPQKITYDNLNGYGISRGASMNVDFSFSFPLSINLGVTYLDVYQKFDDKTEKSRQLHAPKWSGTYSLTYKIKNNLAIDFTGQFYGPMRLPVLPNDYRPEYSPLYSLANIQVSKSFKSGFEVYFGVKNLFNFTPKDPLMRPFDPFDTNVNDPISNPNHYTFDTTYGYAPMQRIRGFLGVKYILK
ncbi:outer membrane receptor for ferrienterochelin and colicins [Chryseobacterium piscicola]|uniref:Outer membrane receptor for ferrienterochelin and colicins n=1 Tax=Chryseobacterium piscicola TaxID=551459 RepID=A0A1N7MEY9_9FLAO|nr:TonB-dependent receptor [Chryseobacterium piscicola]PQA98042.1 TonB-dependent receptor [Chryseobacterium piscicola]SIS84653.1 outer membrane receptor for ferrienterochelin and colicins [Chryseobacterium piscicola]